MYLLYKKHLDGKIPPKHNSSSKESSQGNASDGQNCADLPLGQAPWFSPPTVPYFYPPAYYSQSMEALCHYSAYPPRQQPVTTSTSCTSTVTSQDCDTSQFQCDKAKGQMDVAQDTDAASVLLAISRSNSARKP